VIVGEIIGSSHVAVTILCDLLAGGIMEIVSSSRFPCFSLSRSLALLYYCVLRTRSATGTHELRVWWLVCVGSQTGMHHDSVLFFFLLLPSWPYDDGVLPWETGDNATATTTTTHHFVLTFLAAAHAVPLHHWHVTYTCTCVRTRAA
jgi:hypothetical protein